MSEETYREGNRVGFRGSMNETFKGLSSDGNMESIDVFPSWMGERDQDRVDSAVDFFEKLWNEQVSGITTYRFPSASKEILKSKSDGVRWEEALYRFSKREIFRKKVYGATDRAGKAEQDSGGRQCGADSGELSAAEDLCAAEQGSS